MTDIHVFFFFYALIGCSVGLLVRKSCSPEKITVFDFAWIALSWPPFFAMWGLLIISSKGISIK